MSLKRGVQLFESHSLKLYVNKTKSYQWLWLFFVRIHNGQ